MNKKDHNFFLRRINDMIESRNYVWANDTLTGIKSDIETNERVTDKQIRAIQNIKRAMK